METVSNKDTIAILESKVEKAEGELYDNFEKTKTLMSIKMEEIKVMKGALKNKDDEINRNKNEISKHSKLVKIHEKEIYRLEKINENQSETISNLKVMCKDSKKENNELQKTIKKKT